MRTNFKIELDRPALFKKQLLQWAQKFKEVTWLDSNYYPSTYHSFDAVLAIDAATQLTYHHSGAFNALSNYRKSLKDYIFGYFSYDLKNDTEEIYSLNYDGLEFPEIFFFQPKKLFFIKGNQLEVQYLTPFRKDIEKDLKEIRQLSLDGLQITNGQNNHLVEPVKIHKRITKRHYLKQLTQILAHIHRGDIYEMNFCQEFYAENAIINPLEVFNHLNKISNPPFASFLKLQDHFILSASPERFIRKTGDTIISQPIKGTAKRAKSKKEDQKLARALANDVKERAENIMIVDLVRNDLSKTALKGSVSVEELCKVYTFDQVHQMISTIRAKVTPTINSVDIIKSMFPMGSMTGAPKLSAMEIIEKYEATKRGVYSGSIGFFTPDDDFDFNVVIRSILYNEKRQYLSYSVGGAITSKSDPEKEYQECLLKAIAMKKALKG